MLNLNVILSRHIMKKLLDISKTSKSRMSRFAPQHVGIEIALFPRNFVIEIKYQCK